MRDLVDVHTHTIASGHAYNTMMEMIRAAQEKELEVFGITEHAPQMPGSCQLIYFHNLRVVPRQHGNLELLLGIELNILDEKGTVDMSQEDLAQMDLTIASLHIPCIKPGSREWNTECVVNAIRNPLINIIGHPDDSRYPLDNEAIVQAAKEHDIEILNLCKKYRTPVIMGSDAHFFTDVRNHERIYPLLEETDFPEELVINTDKGKIREYINKYR